MEPLQWLFNAIREPGLGLDSMRRYPRNDYLVVLKGMKLFQIRLRKGARNASLQEIEAVFDAISSPFEIFDDNNLHSSPAALISDKRNSWARVSLI